MATKQQPQMFKYGQSSILIHNDDFEDGYSNGLLGYGSEETHLLTDTALFESIVKNILDVKASNEWNAGYILGTTHSLLLGKGDHTEPDAPQVQLGSVTLRLNNWRFRDGFYTGQEDYQAGQDEREPRHIVTAGDLLRFIAHRDPDTKRYYFVEEEINALEDMLGRFTGYLCAALFLQSAGHTTESLQQHVAVLHEA